MSVIYILGAIGFYSWMVRGSTLVEDVEPTHAAAPFLVLSNEQQAQLPKAA